jgi:hypothetical protein
MKEIRDIKIDMLMGNDNPIIDLFNEITDGIKIMNCNVYNEDGLEFIYYNKNNEWIFYQDIKNKRFWCEYIRYWSNFQTKLNLGYEEIQVITKLLVEQSSLCNSKLEEVLKRELATPGTCKGQIENPVEEALKRELDTPLQKHYKLLPQLEEVLKRELDTPRYQPKKLTLMVEDALKREVDTKPITSRSYKVEDSLKNNLKA